VSHSLAITCSPADNVPVVGLDPSLSKATCAPSYGNIKRHTYAPKVSGPLPGTGFVTSILACCSIGSVPEAGITALASCEGAARNYDQEQDTKMRLLCCHGQRTLSPASDCKSPESVRDVASATRMVRTVGNPVRANASRPQPEDFEVPFTILANYSPIYVDR
jgi:hypothetical protein